MVDQVEFFRIADEIFAEGRQPSQRMIRERLARGGSFSDLGRLYVEWATERGVKLRPIRDDVPKHLLDRLAAAATEIWGDGRRNGVLTAQNERERLTKERDALRVALAEASARADALEESLGIGSGKLDIPNAEGRPKEATRAEKIAFWDRVMQEVSDVLEDQVMSAAVVFRLLDAETHREAPPWAAPRKWSAGLLRDKMKTRSDNSNFFVMMDGGLFRKRTEADDLIEVAPRAVAVGAGEVPALAAVIAVPRIGLRALTRSTAFDVDDCPADEARFNIQGRPST